MAVTRQGGGVTVTCDVGTGARCDRRLATMTALLPDALTVAKACGWRAVALRPGPGFMHVCANCPTPR